MGMDEAGEGRIRRVCRNEDCAGDRSCFCDWHSYVVRAHSTAATDRGRRSIGDSRWKGGRVDLEFLYHCPGSSGRHRGGGATPLCNFTLECACYCLFPLLFDLFPCVSLSALGLSHLGNPTRTSRPAFSGTSNIPSSGRNRLTRHPPPKNLRSPVGWPLDKPPHVVLSASQLVGMADNECGTPDISDSQSRGGNC